MKKIFKLLTVVAFIVATLYSCAVLPTADFTFDPSEVTTYDVVTFSNVSTDALTYAWDFGDGATSTEMSPTHMYTEAGTYTVKLVASNDDGDTEISHDVVVGEHKNYYMLGTTEYVIDAEMFWYAAASGGDPYIRLLTTVSGQDNPDLLKLYVNKGLHELPGTYTWMSSGMMTGSPDVDQFDFGYTANYAGMTYDWTTDSNTAGTSLVITEMESGIYKFEGEVTLNKGNWNWATFEFESEAAVTLTLHYIGAITPL